MNLKSIQFLLISYLSIAFLGSIILHLPIMHNGNITFLDAFFTAASAFTCTGLIVKDTATDFTSFGQFVIMILIQIGGFGYMSMLSLLYILFRRQLSSAEATMLKTALNYSSYDNLIAFIKRIFIFVMIIEFIGAIILTLVFWTHMDFISSVKAGIFHSISAFNNAGFSTFSVGLIDYDTNVALSFTICILIIIGGLGFVVISELQIYFMTKLKNKKAPPPTIDSDDSSFNLPRNIRLTLHTKIVLSYTLALILIGIVVVLVFEWNNIKTLGEYNPLNKLLNAFFLSVNYRSSGFVTFNLNYLNEPTLFFSNMFMLIGGAPGGTAAGIKITTLAVVIAFCMSVFDNSTPNLFNRAIQTDTIRKAFVIFILTIVCLLVALFIFAYLEPDISFLKLTFEVSSALATCGLSTGNGGTLSLSANFTPLGKILIIFLMICGKIGVLAFWLALFGKSKESRVKLISERIIL